MLKTHLVQASGKFVQQKKFTKWSFSYREKEWREVVGVDSRDDGGGVAEEGRHDVHQGQRWHGAGEHSQPGVSHGHDGRWKTEPLFRSCEGSAHEGRIGQ